MLQPNKNKETSCQKNSPTPAPKQTTLLDKQALEDIISGAALLGAGGGGPTTLAHRILKTMDSEQQVAVANLEDVDDNDWAVVAAFIGSPDAAYRLDNVTYKSPARAVKILEKSCGHKAQFIVPVEVGAVNSLVPAMVAHDLGIAVVNADGASRAVPTLSCLTFGTNDELLDKGVAIANETTDEARGQSAVFQVNNASEAESLAGAVVQSPSFANLGGLALWMMQGSQLKKTAIAGGLSRSQALGCALRQAKTNHAEVAVRTMTELGMRAKIIAENLVVSAFDSATKDALDYGKLTLAGENGTCFSIYIVNENMLVYQNEDAMPFMMSPDILCCLMDDGTTLDNSELQKTCGRGSKEKTGRQKGSKAVAYWGRGSRRTQGQQKNHRYFSLYFR